MNGLWSFWKADGGKCGELGKVWGRFWGRLCGFLFVRGLDGCLIIEMQDGENVLDLMAANVNMFICDIILIF